MPFLIVVTGARGLLTPEQQRFVKDALHYHARSSGDVVRIRHGACIFGGVDDVADEYALENPTTTAVERWEARGWASPLARNTAMVATPLASHGQTKLPDLCLAFPNESSDGTWHCAREATRHGITTFVRSLPRR